MEDTAEKGTGIENLPIAGEEIDTRGLLSIIRTSLVGPCVSSKVPQSTVQQHVAMNDQLETELVKIIGNSYCSAKDVERFSTTLNFMANCCGYNLNDASPFLLISAARNDNIAIVLTLLLDHNVQFNNINEANHETILHIACRLKSEIRYAYVLLYPSLLASPDINGHLPIHIACQNNDVQFLSWLFKPILCAKGITSEFSCPISRSSFIEATIASNVTPPLSSIKYIKLSAITLTGHSVFHIAVSQGYSQLFGLLLDVLGATQDVFELDTVVTPDYENKLTPLHVAIAHNETECVRLLLKFLDKHGLLQVLAQEKQVIKIATDVGDANIMKLLVKYGFSQGLEDAIGKVKDLQLKRLLLYYYTQLTTLQAIMDSQSDYRKGFKVGQIRWNGTNIEMIDLAWINDCFRAMESVSQAIRLAEVSPQSLYDVSTTQQLASACLSYFESGMLCTQQFDVNPLIPITVIDIACCSVKSVPPELFQLPSLEVLKLSNNSIRELPTALKSSQCVYSSQSLSTLVLDGNQLRTLPEDLFLGLVNSLEHLSVQKNELSQLPPGLWIMPHLKELNLSENKLSQLHYFCSDDNFNNPSFAEKVVMAIDNDNRVCDLNTFTLHSEIPLQLSVDPKTHSPKEIALQTSNEERNLWQYIQRLEIFYKTLHLATGGKFFVNNVEEWIRFLHEQRGKEGRADESDLESENELPVVTFNEDFETSVLFSLNLSHNMFTRLPEQLPCLAPKLENLFMSHNLIKTVDLVHNMPRNVVTVNLGHNLIEDMATPQPQPPPCGSPSMLLLQQPRDSCCPHTAHVYLKSLASLLLGYNRLVDFHAFEINSDLDEVENVVCSVVIHFPRLSILSLEHNRLSCVPPSIMKLTSLNSLNLAHNIDIVSLPNNLSLLSLCSLNLEGLSLAGIPINLVEKLSPKYLLSYLKGIVHGKEKYRHMKLMLVGSANAGKTTLLLELTKKGKMVHQRPVQIGVNGLPLSTVGVELGEWEYSVTRNLPVITFMTWDFGGQEEYYATHQCFISHRSLYLAIWDARDGEVGLRNMKTWLENIEARAPNAPVIVIGTHADSVKNISALEVAFKKLYIEYNPSSFAYPKIQPHCFFVNSFNPSHMHQLRTHIYLFTQTYKNPGGRKDAIPLIDETIPLYYMAVLKIIQLLVRKCSKQNILPIFSREDYMKEVFQMQFTGNVQEIVEASSFWHDNGIILHHKGIAMDELYCIDPQWLCSTMASVITVQERNPFQKNGFMRMEDFVRLFNVDSTQSFVTAIISIMQSFEVILLLDQQSILIPSLMSRRKEHACAISQGDSGKLSVQTSTDLIAAPIETQKNVLLRHYVLPFVPNGFFSRLVSRICANTVIVAHCRSLFVQCEPQLLCWRNGVSLVCRDKEVLTVGAVNHPLPGTDSTYSVTSAGHEVVKKFSGIEVRVLSDADGVGSTHAATWLLQQAVECIDSIFDDWYIAFGRKRGFDLSMILVGAPCDQCETRRLSDVSCVAPQRSLSSMYRNNVEKVTGKSYFIFSSPFCAHVISTKQELQCPLHGSISASQIAPDLVFGDLPESVVVNAEDIAMLSLLGRGGFGAVFSGTLGRNVQDSQRIAIKTFVVVEDPSGPVESLAWDKYQQASREARVISKLVHDNILGLVGVAIAPLMLLLELAPLGDLKVCVEKFQQAKVRLNVLTLSSTLIQVAKALHHVHSRQFIFRDLKPGNILVWKYPLPETQWNSDSAVYVKLADYGICQQYTLQGVRGEEGTPPYLPPEVVIHCGQQSHSTKLDIYSFGMLMYYLFTFENPFYDDPTRPVSSLLEEGKRPSLSIKQCPPTLGLLELMCWCWSEHPYHRPELKDLISKLEDGVTSQLVTAFPISSADAGVTVVAAATRTTTKSFAFSASFSTEKRLALAPGYLNPFGNTSKTFRSSFKSPIMVLDVWCGGKDGLKHITSQASGHMSEDIEPSEGECVSIVSTLNDRVWVSRTVSGGGRLSIYDSKRNYRIAKWASKECVRKLLYNSSEDVVVATTASSVHMFSDREISDDLNPFLSQPHADTFTQVVLVGVSEGGNEAHLWYSAESKLKALRISAQGITSETFRLYANSTVEHMEALGGTGEGRLKDVVLSHRGCVEKWDVAKQERSAVCDCYDLCSHLCMENYDNSKVTALLYWRDFLYIGTVGGIVLGLNPDSLTALWVVRATETPVRCLAGVSLDPEEVDHKSHDTLPERDIKMSLIVSFGGQYTGIFKGSGNIPPSLKPPGEAESSYDSTPRIKLPTATSYASHMFVLSPTASTVRLAQRDSQSAKQSKLLKHRPTFYTRRRI